MRSEIALINGLPQFLQGIREYKALLGIIDINIMENKTLEAEGVAGYEVGKLWDNIEKSTYGQIPEYADKESIMYLEERYGLGGGIITTDEELAERRARLLNRASLRPPYTYQKIKEQLAYLVDGDAEIDYNAQNHTLTVKTSAVTDELKNEVDKTLRRMLPASVGYTVTAENNWSLAHNLTWAEASGYTWKEIREADIKNGE